MADWDASQYLRFETERTRASVDLLARVPIESPETAIDFGCGPGNSTELLARRFPDTALTGLDRSPDMLAEARERLPSVRFEEADLDGWQPAAPIDLLFANAVLHWLPDHAGLFPRLAGFLAPGGCLAVQMPDNLDEPVHALIRATAEAGPWADKLASVSKARAALGTLEDHYAWLCGTCAHVDVWKSIYVHALDGPEAVVEWIKGSGLRPFLAPLDETEQADFLARYTERIVDAYPRQADGKVLLRFPRLFIVAVR